MYSGCIQDVFSVYLGLRGLCDGKSIRSSMSCFGHTLRLSTFGESHCRAVGGTLEGFPSQFCLNVEALQIQLDRRRAKGKMSTPRHEADQVEILSGTEGGVTLGTPIGFLVWNRNVRPGDYHSSQGDGETYIPRPGHGDYTYLEKYGVHASSGGGRSSARETISRVIGGAIAEQYLLERCGGCYCVAWVSQIGDHRISERVDAPTRDEVDASEVRCPDVVVSEKMIELIEASRQEGDSVGGVVEACILNPPAGLGEPCFDKLEAKLAHAMMSIPATKGFEIGCGFEVGRMRGSEHNDSFGSGGEGRHRIQPITNSAGGTLGGISSGAPIRFRVAFKPPSSISKVQGTVDVSGNTVVLEAKGRHDPCVAHRAVPIVESMAALVMLDAVLQQRRM